MWAEEGRQGPQIVQGSDESQRARHVSLTALRAWRDNGDGAMILMYLPQPFKLFVSPKNVRYMSLFPALPISVYPRKGKGLLRGGRVVLLCAV